MSPDVFLAYFIACIVIVLVPGPTVTLIVANSLRHGTRSGLANVLGTQIGLAILIAIAGIGLTTAIAAMGHWFEWLRLAGAAYLIWLGFKMIRDSRAGTEAGTVPARPRGGFVLQGVIVALSNPKTLIFFGAFFPQFIDANRPYALQIVIMGATALACAAISDSAYALIGGRSGRGLSEARARLMSRIGGSFLIGGGVWLAVTRTR